MLRPRDELNILRVVLNYMSKNNLQGSYLGCGK
jgi:hypothetical protein